MKKTTTVEINISKDKTLLIDSNGIKAFLISGLACLIASIISLISPASTGSAFIAALSFVIAAACLVTYYKLKQIVKEAEHANEANVTKTEVEKILDEVEDFLDDLNL